MDPAALLAHSDWLRALASKLAGPASADDAVQDTFVAALRSPPDPSRPARPWLARVLRNATRMRHRGENRRERREEISAVGELATTESPDDVVARAQTFRMLVDLVLALGEPYRTTIVRHYFDGDTLADIARRDAVPEATVRGWHKAALEQLRTRLDARAGNRRAWLAALAPITGRAGLVIANKVVVAVVVGGAAVLAGAAWKLAPHASPPAPAAQISAGHVRKISALERQTLAHRIADARARRATAAEPAIAESETLDSQTILDAMTEVIPFMRDCIPLAAIGSDGLVVQAGLVITGDPDVGTIIDARQLFDDSKQPLPAAFDDCVRSTLQTLELPPIEAGDTFEFNYTMQFRDGD